jgi:hypothetical protein
MRALKRLAQTWRPVPIRRRVLLGAALALVVGIAPGFAQQTNWNGTWAGYWETGHGAQIIFAGNDFIGIYWHDDYIENAEASLSADGATVTITWPGVHALLTYDGAKEAHIVIRETGRPDLSFPMTRDGS